MNKSSSLKYNEVSLAKGIGILLMVVGHAGCPSAMRSFIYMFHMPLFFIISGYCFKDFYLTDFKMFAQKRIRGLYVPFVKYSLLFILLHNVFYRIGIFNAEYGSGVASEYYSIRTICIHSAQSFLLINHEQLISAVWFIAALFVGYFIFYGVKRYIKQYWLKATILVALSLLLLPFARSGHPIVFRSAFAAFYLWGGHFLSLNYKKIYRWWIAVICFIIVGVGSLLFSTEMPKVDYINFMPYLVCSLSGTLMIMNVSDWLSGRVSVVSNVLGYLGDHTMAILIWHFTCFKIVSAILLILNDMPLLMVAKFPTIFDSNPNCFWPLYTIVGIIVPLLINKFFSSVSNLFKHKFK